MNEMQALKERLEHLSEDGMDLLFGKAHTAYGWQDREVPQATLERLVDMVAMGPTAFNQQPLRVIFVRGAEAKARLEPALSEGNRAKTMQAPVTAIVCYDLDFWKNLPEILPGFDAKPFYEGKPEAARESAARNGTLQGGYMILAARALGLDCGPMSGFDAGKVKAAFLEGRNWEVNFLLNLGYGKPEAMRPRNPRLGFGRIAEVL